MDGCSPRKDPPVQIWVVTKNLHGRFRVGVESGLKLELCDTNLVEKGLNDTNQIPQGQVTIGYQPFNLKNGDYGPEGLVGVNFVNLMAWSPPQWW